MSTALTVEQYARLVEETLKRLFSRGIESTKNIREFNLRTTGNLYFENEVLLVGWMDERSGDQILVVKGSALVHDIIDNENRDLRSLRIASVMCADCFTACDLLKTVNVWQVFGSAGRDSRN